MAKKKELKDLVNAVQRVGQAKTDEEFAEAVDGVIKAIGVKHEPSEKEKFRDMLSKPDTK